LSNAIAHHQRGELEPAERIYRAILSEQPEDPEALQLLGVVLLQRGHPQQAIQLIERAIALVPSIAAYHANLAEAYRAVGQAQHAIACLQIALRLQPVYPQAANGLGSLLMQLGRPAEAAEMFRRAVQQESTFGLAHNNLGNAYRLLGDIPQALAHFRRAVELNPQLGLAHGNLGQLLLECGQLQEALDHCREAVRLQPQSAPARNNFGNVLRRLGHLDKAKACFTEALRLAPNLPMISHNLGHVAKEENKLDDAQRWFQQALKLAPNNARYHADLAEVLTLKGDFSPAEEHLRTARKLEPRSAEAHFALARLHYERGQLEEAQAEYRSMLQLQPTHPVTNSLLGELLIELNQQDEGLACFRSALRGDPHCISALAQLATHLRDKLPADEQVTLRRLIADPKVPDRDRVHLLFGLAQVCDARADYDEAAEHLTRANALEKVLRWKSGQGYNAAAHRVFIDQLLATFTPAFFQRVRGFGFDSERPVFIVGLPRSGTTLLEQVLASHSRVFGAGELRLSRENFEFLGGGSDGVAEARAFAALQAIEADGVGRLAQRQLERLSALNRSAERITDKMPDNYLYLGFLATLFPRARFLHCRRDLRDVAVSCWITQFRQIPWANDAEHIASRFDQYQRVMEHWRHVLPLPVLDVDYEDMVEDLEGVARRVLAFCDLEWEPACLDYYRTHRLVRTASVTQVRQPIYRRSVARWRNYEKALKPLFARLGFADEATTSNQHEELPAEVGAV
jgi:tetratricopeptide (TPR) repeat protein